MTASAAKTIATHTTDAQPAPGFVAGYLEVVSFALRRAVARSTAIDGSASPRRMVATTIGTILPSGVSQSRRTLASTSAPASRRGANGAGFFTPHITQFRIIFSQNQNRIRIVRVVWLALKSNAVVLD